MTAAEALLSRLIDYAGLYPPAALDMRTAVRNYLGYRRGPHAGVLGRFVVNLGRIDELRAAAGDSFPEMRLSVIVPADGDLGALPQHLRDQCGCASFECKVRDPSAIEPVCAKLPAHAECYFEIPMGADCEQFLDAIAAHGQRAKLRMGGLSPDAVPATKEVALALTALTGRRIPFKATAGLHHPIRSRQSFTPEPGSPAGKMHGFLNLAFAAMLAHFGGAAEEALVVLEEEDAGAWRSIEDGIRCRGFLWSADQIRTMREKLFISFGSCSFEEPIHDLEMLGWL